MTWQIRWEERARRELRSLDQQKQREILRYLRDRIVASNAPRSFGKPLVGTLAGLWRYRVGDYRIACSLDDDQEMISITRVGHRREVYD